MKAVIFDMYGVIVKQTGDDFVPYVRRSFPELTQGEILETWFRADAGEIGSLEVWERLGFTGDLEAVEREYLDTIRLNDGFHELIAAVRARYRTAVISNDSSRWSRYLREKFGLDKYFDVISISGDLKMQKPDERIFLLTAEKLRVEPQDCLYIDDREGNLEAAARLGMETILVNSRGVPYDGRSIDRLDELWELLGLREEQQ